VAAPQHTHADDLLCCSPLLVACCVSSVCPVLCCNQQPKQQLDTFRAWAGKSSDINYYLNSHHIDVHNWMVSHMSHPTKVTALAATGVRRRVRLVAGMEGGWGRGVVQGVAAAGRC
jgi:hypothetical protein